MINHLAAHVTKTFTFTHGAFKGWGQRAGGVILPSTRNGPRVLNRHEQGQAGGQHASPMAKLRCPANMVWLGYN